MLLYHWDVDHKRLQVPMDAIGRREKQEMLRLIAYEMQAGNEGLKGNLISAERLTRILTDYLREQGFSEPREKANRLIQQLRERNFILCYRGADSYGFMHRTFLEYFCAVEVVHRFEKQRSLTFEQLQDEVFGNHWQDETWHEVLRLICGMIDSIFAGQLIEFLMTRECDRTKFVSEEHNSKRLKKEGLMNLLLAADCLTEVNSSSFNQIIIRLVDALKCLVSGSSRFYLNFEAAKAVFNAIIMHRKKDLQTLSWTKQIAQDRHATIEFGREDDFYYTDDLDYLDTQAAAMEVIATYYKNEPETLPWLHKLTGSSIPPLVLAAIGTIAAHYRDEPETLPWLHKLIDEGDEEQMDVAMWSISAYYKNNLETLPWLQKQIQHSYEAVRVSAIKAIAAHYKDDSKTLLLLQLRAQQDEAEYVRYSAIEAISENFNQEPGILELLCNIALYDPLKPEEYFQLNPRETALKALLNHYSTHPKTLELLHDRAINDPDEQLREWAQEQLKMQNEKLKIEKGEE